MLTKIANGPVSNEPSIFLRLDSVERADIEYYFHVNIQMAVTATFRLNFIHAQSGSSVVKNVGHKEHELKAVSTNHRLAMQNCFTFMRWKK